MIILHLIAAVGTRPTAPTLLFVQSANETYCQPLLTTVESPTFTLQQCPYSSCTIVNALESQQPVAVPFILSNMRGYLTDPSIWTNGQCNSVVLGAAPSCQSQAVTVAGGLVTANRNILYFGNPGEQGVQLPGNGVSLTAQKTSAGGRTALVYSLYPGTVIGLTLYDSALQVLQAFNFTLSNQTAAALLADCPNFYLGDLVSALLVYCNSQRNSQVDLLLVNISAPYSTNGAGVREYPSTSYAFPQVNSLKINPLVYQFSGEQNWTITFATNLNPELCRLKGLSLECVSLRISLQPILETQVFYNGVGEGTLLYYNQKELFEFKLPQYIHKYTPGQGAIIYASLDEQYIYVKYREGQGSVFVILPRLEQNVTLASIRSQTTSDIFLLPYYSLLSSLVFISSPSQLLTFRVQLPYLQLRVQDPTQSAFNVTVLASNPYSQQQQLLSFQVVLTSPSQPTFTVLFQPANITTKYNLLDLPLSNMARAVGPLINVLSFHLQPFNGVVTTIDSAIFSLASRQNVLLVLHSNYNQIEVAFGQPGQLSVQSFTLNYRMEVVSSKLQPLAESLCYSQPSVQIGSFYTLKVVKNNQTICLCEDRLKCLLVVQSQGVILGAEERESRIFAVEQLGSRVNLLLYTLDKDYNLSLGSFPGSAFIVRLDRQLLISYNSTRLVVYWVNYYPSANQLLETDSLALEPGCVPVFPLNLLLVCQGRSSVQEYRLVSLKLAFLRLIPLYGYSVIALAGAYRSTISVHALFPDGVSRGLLVLDSLYETVSVMRMAVVGEPPFFVSGFEEVVSVTFTINGVDKIALYTSKPRVLAYQYEDQIQLQESTEVELAFSSELYYNSYHSFVAAFNLSSSFIQPIPDLALPYAPAGPALRPLYQALVQFDIGKALGPVAQYRVEVVDSEPGSTSELILEDLFVPLKEVGSGVDLTVYGEIYSLFLVNFGSQCFLNGRLVGATPFYLLLLDSASASYFSWAQFALPGNPEQCEFGLFNSSQSTATLLLFCQLFIKLSTVPFKSSFLLTFTQTPFSVRIANYSFPQIVHDFQSVLTASQTLVVLSTPDIRRGNERNMFVCQDDPSLNFLNNCCGLDSVNGSLVEISFDTSPQNGISIAVVNSLTLDIFVFGDVIYTVERTIVLSNASIPLPSILAAALLDPAESVAFVRILSRQSSQLTLVLTTDSSYLLLQVLTTDFSFQVQKVFSKYFFCVSRANVQFQGGLMLAPCQLYYPNVTTFIQVFNLSDDNPFVRQNILSASQIFAAYPADWVVICTPGPVYGNLRNAVLSRVRSNSRKLKIRLVYKNQYYVTGTNVSLYALDLSTSFLLVNGVAGLIGLVLLGVATLAVRRKQEPVMQIEVEMAVLAMLDRPQPRETSAFP